MEGITVILDINDMILNMFNNDIDIWLYCIFRGKLWSIFGLVRVFEKFYVWAFSSYENGF